MTDRSARRRTFGPVLAAGLAAAGLAAYAGAQDWVRVAQPASAQQLVGATPQPGEMALALPLGLVLLACWGVLLVTRRVVRRLVAALGLLTSLGLAAVAVAALARSAPVTGWFWGAVVTILVSVATTALAVGWCPHWPEMGNRFDAPGGDRREPPAEERSRLDLWKSMDEGRDPTA